mmetsp:Transcript_8687/g.27700  ORF Transcript_8687/g.27700 Transcript_8687/m.27700 type:complete len:526 (-) Transcript_8687:27-1604(-)
MSVLNPNANEEKGEQARLASFVGAIVISDLVKTTLGPRGMDKILQSASSSEITITNDGATILSSIHIDNPAAKILVNISKSQDDEVGDGTTSVCVLAGELLREAEKLVHQRIHPQTIIEGYRLALATARSTLEASVLDHGDDKAALHEDLLAIARVTLSSKIVHVDSEHFAQLCVEAVEKLRGSTDLSAIHILQKQGGSIADSFLADGFVLEKSIGVGQPKRVENPRILIGNTAMDSDRNKIFGVRVRTDDVAQVAAIEEAERKKMLEKCAKIAEHKIDCFINRQLIYNLPEQFFASKGIMAIEHADFEGVERLALVTGAEIASTFESPGEVRLGTCDVIEEDMIGEDRVICFRGCPNASACTIVLRGATKQLLAESERSVHDALCVLSQVAASETGTVLGGGCSEALMAEAVDNLARSTAGKKALAVSAFARALRAIPTILADNAGYDSADVVAKLSAAHHEGKSAAGLNMETGEVCMDMRKLGIIESLKVKRQVLMSASEAAEMILRVDNVLTQPKRQRQQGR